MDPDPNGEISTKSKNFALSIIFERKCSHTVVGDYNFELQGDFELQVYI